MYSRFSMVQSLNLLPKEFRSGSKNLLFNVVRTKEKKKKKRAFDIRITSLFKSAFCCLVFFSLFAWLPRSGIIKSQIKVITDSN